MPRPLLTGALIFMAQAALAKSIAPTWEAPVFECSDPVLEQVYAYRWESFRKHIKATGSGWVITEFLPKVAWEGPYGTLSAAAGHHIAEGRWLKDPSAVRDYLRFWLRPGSGIRNYSFWTADAAWSFFLAQGDKDFALSLLPGLKANFAAWDDHYDPKQGLYWQVPIADATEYTVSGMAVGDGFNGGNAFRPTINAYMFADALALSRFCALAGDEAGEQTFAAKAAALKQVVEAKLWNPQQRHFMDRFSDKYPQRYFQFISHPELAGFVPWAFGLPGPAFNVAWKSLMDPSQFFAPYGPRTLVPSHPEYMIQHRTPGASPGECEWNGPSWPYQTSLVLTGLANLLQGPDQPFITKQDYYTLLQNYARSQFKDGKPYVAENLNPDTGAWIADFPGRSEHYNHSTFADLIITGLAGLRPRADGKVEVNPLIPDSMSYLWLAGIPYQGRNISILWDQDNRRGLGSGLRVFEGDKQIGYSKALTRLVL